MEKQFPNQMSDNEQRQMRIILGGVAIDTVTRRFPEAMEAFIKHVFNAAIEGGATEFIRALKEAAEQDPVNITPKVLKSFWQDLAVAAQQESLK